MSQAPGPGLWPPGSRQKSECKKPKVLCAPVNHSNGTGRSRQVPEVHCSQQWSMNDLSVQRGIYMNTCTRVCAHTHTPTWRRHWMLILGLHTHIHVHIPALASTHITQTQHIPKPIYMLPNHNSLPRQRDFSFTPFKKPFSSLLLWVPRTLTV